MVDLGAKRCSSACREAIIRHTDSIAEGKRQQGMCKYKHVITLLDG